MNKCYTHIHTKQKAHVNSSLNHMMSPHVQAVAVFRQVM